MLADTIEECTGGVAAIGDVTHRRTSDQEQALCFLDALLTSAPMGHVFLDRDLRFLRINDQLAEINGLSVAAHLGRTVAEILPALEATLREVTARILETGQPVLNHEFSGETARAPGITRYWNESWYPVRDKRGEIIGFGAVVEETTARKQAEAAVRLTNERFELAVMTSKVVLWQQDLELRFTWLHNPAPGIDGSNSVGKTDADLLERPEDVAVIVGLKREVIRSGVGLREEFFAHIQGVGHYFEVLIEPLRDAAGLITGLTGAAIDITERKRADEAQHEREQHYQALAEASADIPYRMSADWATMLALDGRGLFVSSVSPLADWAWVDQYIPSDEQACVRQAISDAIARKNLFELEHRILRPDRSTGWVRSRAVPILDDNEGLVTWFGAASDITERKRIEQNLIEATAVAEKANRAKSDFLSSMSHELRTPLNAILGFAQLLEAGQTLPTPAHKRSVDHILQAGWYLLGLINEILDLAQVESGNVELSWESIPLADVMLDCQSLIEPLAQKRGINVRFPQFDIPCFVKGDRTRLKQILINLLSNAIKYNKTDGGSVWVDCTLATPDSIRIGVRDTGAGLTAEQLAQLFQPFNRLGRNAGTQEGTGIGLMVAKGLVELMGGTIGVESTVGVGSVFWIEMTLMPDPPVVVREAKKTVPVSPARLECAPRSTVLYVEDNATNLELVQEFFTRHPDVRLLSATDGQLGIDLARTFGPDVILMDINMPGMNGIQAMKTLRADPSTKQIPVIAVSAYAMPVEIERSLENGFFSYLTKPIKFNELMTALDVAIKFSQTKSAPADAKTNEKPD